MKKLKSALTLVSGLYFLTAVLFFTPYYNWMYARENGFLNWLFFGEIIATGKAMIWPYFTLSDLRKASENGEHPSPTVSLDHRPREYTDNEYNYAFQFPADWKMKSRLNPR